NTYFGYRDGTLTTSSPNDTIAFSAGVPAGDFGIQYFGNQAGVPTDALGDSLNPSGTGSYQSASLDRTYSLDVTVTPEPATMLLFGTGLLGIAFVMRKQRLR